MNPFPHTTAIKEICFYLSVFIVLALVACRKVELLFKTPLLLPFGLFVFWSFLSIFFALDKGNSANDFYTHLLKYIIFYYILINFFNSRQRLAWLSWIFIISAVIFSIGGFVYYYFILDNVLTKRFMWDVIQAPTNTIVVVLLFAAILSLHFLLTDKNLYHKMISLGFLFPLFATTVLTQTRSVFVAMVPAAIVLLIRNKKALIISIVVILLVFFTMPVGKRFEDVSLRKSSSRIQMNFISLEIIKDYPIIGTGFDAQPYGNILDLKMYNKRIPDAFKARHIPNDPHNLLLGLTARLGIVGLVLFLYILFVFCRMCWRVTKYGKDNFIRGWGLCVFSLMVMFFVSGFFETHCGHMTEVIFCIIFAMVTILWRLDTEEALISEGR
ncbi:MAG: O-antigen ligase family protein [Syntrophobacterales bacterium]|nr:O-antigen ligase family protein [Syntrophobacterales bacterium]